jgi:hypothetical protein
MEKESSSQPVMLWKLIIIALNFIAVSYLVYVVKTDGSDKSIILLWFFYPVIIATNIILWYKLRRNPISGLFKIITIILLILFFPLLFI